MAVSAQTFDLQGHRGCRGLMPENTLPAFRKALDLGVTTLEMDVVLSADGQVVVSHDPFFDPAYTTGPDGRQVYDSRRRLPEMTYSDIRRYDVGLRQNPAFPQQQVVPAWKPLLEEAIRDAGEYASRNGLPAPVYSIELKGWRQSPAEAERFSDRVNACLRGLVPPERILIQSFDAAVLRYWHRNIASGTFLPVRLSMLSTWKGLRKIERQLGFRPAVFSPYWRRVSRRLIRKSHEKGIKLVPWTVNSPRIMRRMIRWEADGLLTDYPDRFPR